MVEDSALLFNQVFPNASVSCGSCAKLLRQEKFLGDARHLRCQRLAGTMTTSIGRYYLIEVRRKAAVETSTCQLYC